MTDITQADQKRALSHLGYDSMEDAHYWAADNNELNRLDALVDLLARHRIEAESATLERAAQMAEALGADRIERDERGALRSYDMTCKVGRSDAILNAMRVRAQSIATAIRQLKDKPHDT